MAEGGAEHRGDMDEGVDFKGECGGVEKGRGGRRLGKVFHCEQRVRCGAALAGRNRVPGGSQGGIRNFKWQGRVCVPGGWGMSHPVGGERGCAAGGGRGAGKRGQEVGRRNAGGQREGIRERKEGVIGTQSGKHRIEEGGAGGLYEMISWVVLVILAAHDTNRDPAR